MEANTPKFWPSKGHLNLDQYDFIKNLLKDKHIKYGLETGFCTGRSAISVLTNCPDLKKMISIEINLDYAGLGGRAMSKVLSENFNCYSVIESDSKTQFSSNFFEENYPDGIDYSLVDGDHSYTGCMFDLTKITPHVNKGGIILIDDYKSGPPNGCNLPDVDRACNDFYEKNKDILIRDEWNKDGKGFCIFTIK